MRAAVRRAGELRAAHDAFMPDAVRLLGDAADPAAAADALTQQLTALVALHTGRPGPAAGTADRIHHALAGDGHRAGDGTGTRAGQEPDALLTVARRLAQDGAHATGMLALALLHAARDRGTRDGSGEPWRVLLRQLLRRHPEPDVRDRALATPTAPE